jgi:8-hydroxy-5-deazaflavin:NADPH oxidoreductase
MNIAVLGSGVVGRSLSSKLIERGHDVVIGTRDVDELLARPEVAGGWVAPFSEWYRNNDSVDLATFSEAAERGEIIFNATAGGGTLDALKLAGEDNLDGKILVDISNPLDFSHGMPPTLFVCNTESLAEQIQQAFPGARVVKTLNTLTASLMVDPASLAGGDHHVFVSSDDGDAKERVVQLLKNDFGWKEVIDLGDLKTARAAEMLLPMWLALINALGTPTFNFKVVR